MPLQGNGTSGLCLVVKPPHSPGAGTPRVLHGPVGVGWYQERMTCASCRSGMDHCHGTLVLHSDGEVDCTDQGCVDTDIVRHTLVIECHSIEGGCGCAEPSFDHEELRRAS